MSKASTSPAAAPSAITPDSIGLPEMPKIPDLPPLPSGGEASGSAECAEHSSADRDVRR